MSRLRRVKFVGSERSESVALATDGRVVSDIVAEDVAMKYQCVVVHECVPNFVY